MGSIVESIDEEYKAYNRIVRDGRMDERARAEAAEAARAAVLVEGDMELVVYHASEDARRKSHLAGNTAAVACEFSVRAAEAARAALRAKADAAYDAAYLGRVGFGAEG